MNPISLLGGGGHASDVLTVVEALARGEKSEDLVIYVADDRWERPDRFEARSHVHRVDSIEAGAKLAPFLVAVGFPGPRRAVRERALAAGGQEAAAVVHPSADVGAGTVFQNGVVVMGKTWLSAGISVGAHVHIGYGVTIGHDAELGQFAAVMPGACIGGDTAIGDGALIGANATVLQGLSIGADAVVGAGAVVTKDLAPGITVVGSPARRLDR